MSYEPQPSRTEVRTLPCPACGAQAAENCLGTRAKIRESNHQERVDAYILATPRWNG